MWNVQQEGSSIGRGRGRGKPGSHPTAPKGAGAKGSGRGRARGVGGPSARPADPPVEASRPSPGPVPGNPATAATYPDAELTSSDEEENIESQEKIQSSFDEYLKEGGGDQQFEEGISRIRQHLNTSICLICLEKIPREAPVWSCQGCCYTVFHLICIQSWAKQEADRSAARSDLTLPAARFPEAAAAAHLNAKWHCPKCRWSYTRAQIPSAYLCFCGQERDPAVDLWSSAHCCGEVCRKPLARVGLGGAEAEAEACGGARAACSHLCTLLCHPGPCPPCPRTVSAPCFCGAVTATRRCGSQQASCGRVCARPLGCGTHRCTAPCHAGSCAPCGHQALRACACGKLRKALPCSAPPPVCAKPCGKPLACGHHQCKEVCHAGECRPCEVGRAGARTCHCGKQPFPAASCAEPTPTCGGTCEKLLPCGRHRCLERCHEGECSGKCLQMVEKQCRCGGMTKAVVCTKDLLCDRKCARMRDCKRHACKRRCCEGATCPPCTEVCNRRLMCGNHKCQAQCHDGPCLPCPRTVVVGCACGRVRTEYPCGRDAAAAVPRCSKPCAAGPLCRHRGTSRRSLHPCHFGPCPPCPAPSCATPRACGHRCAEKCHDPALSPGLATFEAWLLAQKKRRQQADMILQQQQQQLSRVPPPPPDGPDAPPPLLPPPALPFRAALADLAAAQPGAAFAPQGSECPPCVQSVRVACVGQHEQRAMSCCEAGPYACEAPCGRVLPCSNHTCARPCHKPTLPSPAAETSRPAGEDEGAEAGGLEVASECERCERPCEAALPGCGHKCAATCHPPPCPPCEVTLRRKCHCARVNLTLPCVDLTAAQEGGAAELAPLLSCGGECGARLPECPHMCPSPCHPPPCPQPEHCKRKVTVRCGCKRLKRQWECGRVLAALADRPNASQALAAYRKSASMPGGAPPPPPCVLPCEPACQAKEAPSVEAQGVPPPEPPSAAAAAQDGAEGRGRGRGRRGKARVEEVVEERSAFLDPQTLETILHVVRWALTAAAGIAIGLYVYQFME